VLGGAGDYGGGFSPVIILNDTETEGLSNIKTFTKQKKQTEETGLIKMGLVFLLT